MIIDYLHIEQDAVGKALIFKELNAKLEENTVQNFLNKKDNWTRFNKYFIVLNLGKLEKSDNRNQITDFIKSFNFPKDINFLLFSKVVSDDFQLASIF